MGVIDAERRVLLFQMLNDARQHHMFQNIRMIARMIGVTVVHGPAQYQPRSGARFSKPRTRATKSSGSGVFVCVFGSA